MKIFLFCFVICLLGERCKSQIRYADSTKNKYDVDLGLSYFKTPFIEIGVAGPYRHKDKADLLVPCFAIDFGYNNKLIFGPKIAIEYYKLPLHIVVKNNLIYYTDFNRGQWNYRPEIGYEFTSFSLRYGFNIPIQGQNVSNLNRHYIALYLTREW